MSVTINRWCSNGVDDSHLLGASVDIKLPHPVTDLQFYLNPSTDQNDTLYAAWYSITSANMSETILPSQVIMHTSTDYNIKVRNHYFDRNLSYRYSVQCDEGRLQFTPSLYQFGGDCPGTVMLVFVLAFLIAGLLIVWICIWWCVIRQPYRRLKLPC